MSETELDGILDAASDQHAVALAVRMGAGLMPGIADTSREARLILAHVMGAPLHRLAMADFTAKRMDRYIALCEQRRNRVPMSHILGFRSFWKHEFKVTPDVLDPRPETETLVEAALEVPFRNVLDLGTGSGAILISLLVERPSARGVGTDMSDAGILVAGENALNIGVVDRLILPLSDWFDDVGGMYDLIVSNPPYIGVDEMAGLAPELSHEPRMALTDEGDGLGAYRAICSGAPTHLTPGGWLMVEIGPTQAVPVIALFEAAGLVKVQIRTDLDGRDRVVLGQKPQ